MKTRRMSVVMLLIIVLMVGLTMQQAAGAPDAIGKASFDWVFARKLTVTTLGAQFQSAVTMDDDLIVTGDTALGGALDVDGATTLAGMTYLTAGTGITVTNGAAFTATASIQPIRAATAVTPTITIPAAGARVCLYNTSANAITIADTGNQVLSGNVVLGQYDWLCLWSDGTRVMQTSTANN